MIVTIALVVVGSLLGMAGGLAIVSIINALTHYLTK